MKNIAITITLVVMIMMSIFIVEALHEKEYRTVELSDAVDNALTSTLNNVSINRCYKVNSNEEFVEDFRQMLMTQISSDCDIDINIIAADYEKGILSVNVVETFDYINGRKGTLSKAATVILEQNIEEREYFTVTYYVGDKEYKRYQLVGNSKLIKPKDPELEGYTFIGWMDENGEYVDFDSDAVNVYNDTNLYAYFE